MPEVKYGTAVDEVARRRELEEEELEIASLRKTFIGIGLVVAAMTMLLSVAIGISQPDPVDATAKAGVSQYQAKDDQ